MTGPLRRTAWALLATAVLWHGLLPIAGFDVWWQLALGRDWIENGWPDVDTWSHTQRGQPWPYKDGGSALVYWAVWSGAGVGGLVVLKALVFGATALGWAALVQRLAPRSPALAVGLAALMVTSTAFRFTIRPQIFSFAILVACAWLVVARRGVWRLAGLVVLVWVNAWLHRAALLIPPLLVLWFAARWVDHRRGAAPDRAVPRVAWVAVAASAASVVAVPDGLAIVESSLAMVSDPVLHGAIPEWWSSTPQNVWRAAPATWIVLGIVGVAALVEVRRDAERGGPRAEVIVLLVLGVAVAGRGVRFLPYLILISGLGVAMALADRQELQGRLAPGIGLVSAAAALVATLTRPLPLPALGVEAGRLPEATVAFIEREAPSGPLFNDFAFGGYLIFTLDAEVPVYIDGRNDIVYPAAFIREYVDAVRDPSRLTALLDARGIEWVVLPTTPDRGPGVAWERGGAFAPVFATSVAVTYVRRGGVNHAIEERHAYRHLRPLDVSASLYRAAADPRAHAAMTAEVRRLLADDPDGRYAHVVAARWFSLLGPDGAVDSARQERWLREQG